MTKLDKSFLETLEKLNFFHYVVRKLILFTATQREQMKEEHVKGSEKER